MSDKKKVRPLRARISTLDGLQQETLKVLRQVRRQLHRSPYHDGLSDDEFIEQVIEPLETKIRNDREMTRIQAKGR